MNQGLVQLGTDGTYSPSEKQGGALQEPTIFRKRLTLVVKNFRPA